MRRRCRESAGRCRPAAAAPRIASVTAWQTASASEWPSSPLSNGMVTPPRMSGRPPAQPMQVVAVADAQRRHACCRAAPDKPLGRRKILGSRDLQVAGIAVHQVHAMSGALGQHRFIGRVGGMRRLRQRVAQHVDAKRLRRLRQEDLVARNRVDDEALGIASLDGIGRRQRRNRRAEPDRGIDRPPDQLWRHQRTRRVVNHHDVRVARRPWRTRWRRNPAAARRLRRSPPASARCAGSRGRSPQAPAAARR